MLVIDQMRDVCSMGTPNEDVPLISSVERHLCYITLHMHYIYLPF